MSGNLSDVVFDYAVVGGGSAGVVIAARLSEDPRASVLLIEAGEDYLPGAEPAPIRDTFHTAVYRAENMWPGLLVHWRSSIANDGSQLPPRRYEQARIMGGGSSINAMAAIRGFPDDYDDWERGGASGWSWESVLPYFSKLESDQDFSGTGHGDTGPIPIRRNKRENWPPFSKAAAAVLEGQGFGFVADLNTDFRDGLCAIPVSSLPTHRVSTARGYLTSEVRAQRNLIILSKTYASSIMIKDMKAVGVRIKARSGEESEVACNEVVVAAGALHTPALLLRAGVGDAKHLQEMGIRVVSNGPEWAKISKIIRLLPWVFILGVARSRLVRGDLLPTLACVFLQESLAADLAIAGYRLQTKRPGIPSGDELELWASAFTSPIPAES